ncbi:hypothetical protein ACQP1G_02530 [Nocardia sp. CA-107356]|uniref:hypothetical protein n=1 Tax=Nocardia sp. CA-107356 TaxID=3239972 RepID=UPI003D8D0884
MASAMLLRQHMRQLHVRGIAQRLRRNEYLSPGRAADTISGTGDIRAGVDFPSLVVNERP